MVSLFFARLSPKQSLSFQVYVPWIILILESNQLLMCLPFLFLNLSCCSRSHQLFVFFFFFLEHISFLSLLQILIKKFWNLFFNVDRKKAKVRKHVPWVLCSVILLGSVLCECINACFFWGKTKFDMETITIYEYFVLWVVTKFYFSISSNIQWK